MSKAKSRRGNATSVVAIIIIVVALIGVFALFTRVEVGSFYLKHGNKVLLGDEVGIVLSSVMPQEFEIVNLGDDDTFKVDLYGNSRSGLEFRIDGVLHQLPDVKLTSYFDIKFDGSKFTVQAKNTLLEILRDVYQTDVVLENPAADVDCIKLVVESVNAKYKIVIYCKLISVTGVEIDKTEIFI